ncbi:sigma-70 family RNA polymerase sigma factor [Pedobacter sp. PLR]|uniref:RNA polymerase sigma factor n=1 Tax=Pedobacter sp. PLR TaxID=2994465 RepID=UPI002246D830|nr:sigma-70 family RNA polymerase sigma factor [Pedobacter sp. PLR]MCX2450855.1 sigma-70 family RNA polymerase sigma factor [Pedobacter sp. PLR]
MNANHSTSDDGLMLRLRQGDELAFTEIYNRYWDKLYYIAHKLLKDQEAAEGIVQDVFLMIWKKREDLNMDCIPSYLAAMTRYAVFRYLSKEKRSKQQENIVGLLTANATSEIDIDHKILLEIITELSNKLPEKCRLVFQYNKLQDQSLAEVAAQLNMSQKTAEAHLTKALRIIRSNVGDVLNFLIVLYTMTIFR